MHLSLAHVIPRYRTHTRRIAQLLSQLSIAGQPQLFIYGCSLTSDHMVQCLELLHWQTAPRVSHLVLHYQGTPQMQSEIFVDHHEKVKLKTSSSLTETKVEPGDKVNSRPLRRLTSHSTTPCDTYAN